MVVRAEGPWRSVQDIIAAAKARPATLTYGSGGAGSSNHLSGALFASAAGIRLEHISYRGAAPAMTALLAGEIDMVFASTVETLPHVQAGRARLLGVATERRVPSLPDTPAIAEIVPGYVALNWYAIAAPQGLPPPIVAKLSADPGHAARPAGGDGALRRRRHRAAADRAGGTGAAAGERRAEMAAGGGGRRHPRGISKNNRRRRR